MAVQNFSFLLSQVRTSAKALVGGKAYFYEKSTTTPKTIWINSTGTTVAANPYTLDANATAKLYGTGLYRVVIKDSAGVTQFDWDGVFCSGTPSTDALLSASVYDYGAVGDGTTDDRAAFAAGDAATSGLLVLPGSYKIGSSLTLSKPVTLESGASFVVPNGVTVTFNGGFNAGIQKCFTCTGTGAVVFNPRFTSTGYPEWWGAVTGDGNADCTAALTACVTACIKTVLQASDYWINTTWKINTPNRIIEGTLPSTTEVTLARIVGKSATADIIVVGPDGDPGSINLMTQNIRIKGITVWRASAVVPPSAGNEINGPAGFRFRWILNCVFEDLLSYESALGFAYNTQVYNFYYRCKAFRSTNGSIPVNDIFYAHSLWAVGTYGIQSVFFSDLHGIVGGTPALSSSIGIAVIGSFTDIVFNRPECDKVDYGMFIDGSVSTIPSIDNHIVGGIFDQCGIYGVLVSNLMERSQVSIVDTYAVLSNTAAAVAAFSLQNTSNAQFSITNCQSTGIAGTTAVGLYLSSVNGVIANGNMWQDLTRPIVMSNCYGCSIEDNICNKSVTTTQGAIEMLTASRNYVKTIIHGGVENIYSSSNGGVRLDSACAYNEINCTLINPFGIQGNANKLIYNGVAVTTNATFGIGNISTGIMG